MLPREELEKITQEANKGNADAQHKLGLHYKEVRSSYFREEEDPVYWFTKAAQQKHSESCNELLTLLLEKNGSGDYWSQEEKIYQAYTYCLDAKVTISEPWVKRLESHIRSGVSKPKANYILALVYEIKGDVDACLKSLERGVELKDVEAVNKLWDLYYYGKLVKKDWKKAYEVLKQACPNPNGYNCVANKWTFYVYAWMLHNSKVLEKSDIELAIKFYEKSLPEKNDANYQLGKIYYDKYLSNKQKKEDGWQYEAYKREALKYFAACTGQNKGDAQYHMGLICLNDNNPNEAEKHFLTAESAGSIAAKYHLGNLYVTGKFAPEKQALSLKKYQEAAEAGYADAQYKMAELHETGNNGCEKNNLKAFLWLRKAANQSHTEAQEKLATNPIFAHINSLYKYLEKNLAADESLIMAEIIKVLELEQKLDYQFKELDKLYQALDRTMDETTKEARFQRLEFLGDGILNAAIRELLLKKLPADYDVGKINEIYQPLVDNTKALPRIAKDLGLATLIKKAITEAAHDINEKMLADATEALIGAVHLDGGFEASTAVISKLWEPHLEAILHPVPVIPEQLQVKSKVVPQEHGRRLSETSVTLQQSLLGMPPEELEQMLKTKHERALIVDKHGDTLLHSLARQLVITRKEKSRVQCGQKMNLLLQYEASVDIANKKGETVKEILEKQPGTKLEGRKLVLMT